MMENIEEYDPLKWPPDLKLAKIHMKCVCPGKDNVQGIQCPCCGRYEKIKVRNWAKRDIMKDFKSYGGGIPSYFQLMKYFAISLIFMVVIVIIYHIYIIETTCPLIYEEFEHNKLQLLFNQCQVFIGVFKICSTKIIIETLNKYGQYSKANAFFILQMISFLYLIAATIGMKIWLQRVNMQKIITEDKVYSDFSLMIKNIPKFYQIQDVKKELELIIPGVEICEIFFVYEIAELQTKFKRLFDLHFQVQFLKQSVATERGGTREQLDKLILQYGSLYDEVDELKKKIGVNNGRAIVVFNNYEQRNQIYKALKINECSKLIFHTMKILGKNTLKLHFFADKICQPQQILWKNIGESSVAKTGVRIKTTLLGFGFMIVAFLALYFPIIKIDVNAVLNHGSVSSALSFIISLVLQILAIVYRQIILKILPTRYSSSRGSESYFIVITTVIFHFFFYNIAPGTYYVIDTQKIPINIKLKQLFVTVLISLIMGIIIAAIDLRYRIFNSRRKNIMGNWARWSKYCQIRLHQQIRWPSFPIQFKLMFILNIWAFTAFYIFQMPYLMFLFLVVILVVYLIDKKNLYKHYKMQVYQSIELQVSVQRDYIIIFLICVSLGYAACVVYSWQYYFIGGVAVASLLINFLITYTQKRQQKQLRNRRTMTLSQAIKAQSTNPKKSMLHNLFESEFRENALFLDHQSSVSLGSATFHYGYKQLYDNYLNQFKNKQILNLLEKTYNEYKDPNFSIQQQITRIKRITELSKLQNIKVDNQSEERSEKSERSERSQSQVQSKKSKKSHSSSSKAGLQGNAEIQLSRASGLSNQ